MKKTAIIIVVLLLSLTSYSQAKFGIRGGVNLVNLTNLETKSRTDFYGGVFLAIKKSQSYALQPEINYSMQGAKLISKSALNEENKGLSDIKIELLSLGLINKITTKNNIKFIIGPFIDIRISDNVKNDEYLLEGLFPRIDVGVQAGLGYDINDLFSVEVRFKQGFIDAINENDIYEEYHVDDENFNQVIKIGVLYKFDLKQ